MLTRTGLLSKIRGIAIRIVAFGAIVFETNIFEARTIELIIKKLLFRMRSHFSPLNPPTLIPHN